MAHSTAKKYNIENAINAFHQGKLEDAYAVCQGILQKKKNDINALNLAGIIADAKNLKEQAADYFRQAVKLDPRNLQLVGNLAGVLIDLNSLDEVKKLLQPIATKHCTYAEIFYNLGNVYLLEQNEQAAKQAYEKAIKIQPQHIRALNNLASLNKTTDPDSSKQYFNRILELDQNHIDALLSLASIYFQNDEYQAAEKYLLRVLSILPDNNKANHLMGVIQRDHHENDIEAINYFVKAYNVSPNETVVCNSLANQFCKLGQLDKAEMLFKRSLELDPQQINIANELAQLYHEIRKHDESIKYYQHALSIDPNNSSVLNNIGHVTRETGDIDKAIEYFKRSIDLEKDLSLEKRSVALNNLALNQLSIQNFSEGWESYRFRPSIVDSELSPCLDKEQITLHGKNILWMKDQGIGDELFFLRFAPQLAQYECQNSYRCNNKLAPLIERLGLFDKVYREDVDQNEFDCVLSIGDLPYLLGHTNASQTPPPLKLIPNKEKLEKVKGILENFGPPPYIGLTWRAGRMLNNKRVGTYHKQLDLPLLCNSLKATNGTLVCIQVNPVKEDLDFISKALDRPVLDVSAFHDKLDDMLCVLDCLDHYFTVSNTYVHMREGLGKGADVFVINPPEWRWLIEGEKSFWFPNCRTYRQKKDGSWQDAFTEFNKHLEHL